MANVSGAMESAADVNVAVPDDAVFSAVADPTRRRVLEVLRSDECSVRHITDAVGVSQSAVSQHLKVLRDAGIVTARSQGTRRLYRVEADGLSPVRAWVDSFWDDALGAFAAHAQAEHQRTGDKK